MTTTDLARVLVHSVWFFLKTIFLSFVTAFTVMITMNGQFPDTSYVDFWQYTWAGMIIVSAGMSAYRYGEELRRA